MHQPQVGAFFNGGLSGGDENRATRPQAGEKQSGGLFFSPWVESHRFRHQAEPGRNSRSGLSFFFCPLARDSIVR